ncbi:MAG TPA: hypothetical protein DEG17_01675 [Cyanobacteria bacterium UBA11149]|nr:hypothetical protein [Cyanobacteria bacterium UBA11366]HBK66369.1 hypothetical protein [Cyanobacteria bacterium UBA11166]HBR74135.1 hypothetical protein [Cyanobacteria bacterium UBA11159]HBS71338.1 hypothetical protein [Cyanobacteria bacterium UBA11153]HBW87619.1 hypothetical protein [Cyanobacteria bacterium UBA11149]HCA95083.1 hypothetical protein [Cyanobacteria bacterium UBA9226]
MDTRHKNYAKSLLYLITCANSNKPKNLTPQPPSLQGKGDPEILLYFSIPETRFFLTCLEGKGEPEILLPSPCREGLGEGLNYSSMVLYFTNEDVPYS